MLEENLPGPNPSQMRPEDRVGLEGYDDKGFQQTNSFDFDVFGNVVGGTGAGAGTGTTPPATGGTDGLGGGTPGVTSGSTTTESVTGTPDIASVLAGISSGGLMSTSENIAQLQADKEARRKQIEERFKPEFERLAEEKVAGTEGSQVQSKRLGGMGFSTVAKANIQNEIKFRNKNIADMKAKEEEAIANSDFNFATEIRKARVAAEKDRIDLMKWGYEKETDQFRFEKEEERAGKADIRADKSLEYQMGAEGRTISAEERAVAESETKTVQSLALEYNGAGADIKEDDSLAVATEKASQWIEESRLLELEKLQGEIDRINQLASGSGGSGPSDTNSQSAIIDAAKQIRELQKAGPVSEESYWNIINELSAEDALNADPNDADKWVINAINDLEGKPRTYSTGGGGGEVDQDVGSDYDTGSANIGKTVGDSLKRGVFLPEMVSLLSRMGGAASNLVAGLVGGEEMSKDDIKKVSEMFGGY